MPVTRCQAGGTPPKCWLGSTRAPGAVRTLDSDLSDTGPMRWDTNAVYFGSGGRLMKYAH
jgi:hypothetical protein